MKSNLYPYFKSIKDHQKDRKKLHWTLDMTFSEDRQRKRDKNTAQNFAKAQKPL